MVVQQTGIILLASERSGSNLLRTLLGNHHLISAPVAPHLLSEFYPERHYYGDLRKEKNIRFLISDMVATANHPYHNWNLKLKDNISLKNCNSVISAVDFIYKQKALNENKHHYCSKEINLFKYIDQIRAEIKNIKFIHLVRDPRDHVASWMKRPVYLLTPYDAILKWREEQSVFIDAIKTRGLNCISVKYEDLISNTPEIMTKILNYLNLPVDKKCFSTDINKSKNLTWNPLWKNLSKPVMKENKNKFLKELSSEDINIIETVAQQEMSFFNYSFVSSVNWVPPKNFNKILQKQRTEKKKSVNISFKELEEKQKFIRNLKTKRIKKQETFSSINIKQEYNNSFKLKTKLKYLSFALIGENLTYKIIKKLKK